MRIESIAYRAYNLKLQEPYLIAYEEVDEVDNIILQINTDQGICGWGCAAPDLHVTGETMDDVLHILENSIEPILHNADPMHYQ